MFLVEATCEPEKQQALREATLELIDGFAAKPIPDEQLNRARRLIASAHLFSLETTGATSVQTGYYYVMTGGVDFLDRYLERLEAVTADQAQAAFRSLLERYEWVEVSVGPKANGAS